MDDMTPRDPRFLAFEGLLPKVDPTAFIASTAVLVGDVTVGAGSSVWFHLLIGVAATLTKMRRAPTRLTTISFGGSGGMQSLRKRSPVILSLDSASATIWQPGF